MGINMNQRMGSAGGTRPVTNLLFFVLALAISLWVAVANGDTLFYFDTDAYLDRGEQMLTEFGVIPLPEPIVGSDGQIIAQPEKKNIDGSRSPIYSVVLGLFAAFNALEGAILVNALLAIVAIWLPLRIAMRLYAPSVSAWLITLIAVAVSALGSYAFYVAFLMPDILAPVLLIVAATYVAFGGRMLFWEIALAFFLGVTAVSLHLSHQAIVVLLIPVTFVVSLAFGGKRRLMAPILIGLIALIGYAEQTAFKKAVQTVTSKEVTYLPFLTARLIEDKVGYRYLEANCPDEAIVTCKLYDALQLSDDPWRLTATHISFEKSERLGSFRRMPQDDQAAVANNQVNFFKDVLMWDPVGTALAFLNNTLTQARLNSVNMTLPSDSIVNKLDGTPGLAFTEFEKGRLAANTTWVEPITPAQQTLYLVSLLVVLAGIFWPGMPRRARAFLLMILLGILVNAFVCGGVSQPATRYGARVIWLLPMAAVLTATLIRALPGLRASGYYEKRKTAR